MTLSLKRRNVYLIDLGTGTDRNLLPLSIGLIASYARSLPQLAQTCDFQLLFLRRSHDEMARDLERPFVVGLASYVWNARATLSLARAIKAAHPGALIVLGGYSVPKAPDRVAAFFSNHPWVDVLVHGEGEYTFADLLVRLLSDRDLAQVEGISFRGRDAEQGFVTTARRGRIDSLDSIPSPFLNGIFDDLMARLGKYVTGAVWETNRGCPFSCTFCDWGNSDVSKVKKFDVDRLHAEIDWMSRNKIYYIYGADANFGIFYDRDLEIAGRIADRCEATGYPKYLMINWTKNSHERIVAIADRLAKGGVMTSVTLAMQSFHGATLDAIKRSNIKQNSLIGLKKAFHDRDLPTYTEIILGLPMEDYNTFRHGVEEAMTRRLSDHFVIYLCTLLENTEMATATYRLKYKLESRYCVIGMSRRQFDESEEPEVEEFVVGTSTMPIWEWQKSYLFGYMTTALFNHRVAFFPMHYLQSEFGTSHGDFVEFCNEELVANPGDYPQLYKALRHIRSQSELILRGESSMSGPEGLEKYSLTPHEAALALMIYDVERLYRDLGALILQFCAKRGFVISKPLLDSILRYQRLRMPAWRESVSGEHLFQDNVPEYFDALASGSELPVLTNTPTLVVIEQLLPAEAYTDFAVKLVRGGHTLMINGARLGGQNRQPIPIRAVGSALGVGRIRSVALHDGSMKV